MSRGGWAFALVALLAATALLTPSLAHADGDPASDVLVSHRLFLPFDAHVSHARQARLEDLLAAAQRAGFPVRVAMIPSEYDLGAVGVLWGKPETYARFLGIELSLTYRQRLLVVMPNGFGFNWPHHSKAEAEALLAKIPITGGGVQMLQATEEAIHRLAAAEGVAVDAARSASSGRAAGSDAQQSSTISVPVVLLLVLAALALAALVLSLTVGGVHGVHRPAALGGVLVALCLAVAVPLLFLLGGGHRSAAKPESPASAATPASSAKTPQGEAPTIFAAGRRQAPNFHLVDQEGHGISPAAYRGRPVIVTFIDPFCRELCPLAAKVLSEAAKRLPMKQRPQIIAVSVDVYADTKADLDKDFRRWDLVPQWQWAVGSHRQLAAVWSRYYAEVEVKTKRIAGTTVHYVTHSEMAYLIDAKGYERALFSWPYTPSQVDAEVRKLAA